MKFWMLVRANKRYLLIPIFVITIFVVVRLFILPPAVGPFIYTVF